MYKMKVCLLLLALLALARGKEIHKHQKLAHSRALHQNRVSGGSNARIGQIPYIVSLQTAVNGSWFHICGGSIIGRSTILTAAHCVTNAVPDNLQIRAGILNLDDDNTTGQTIPVASFVVHPDYVLTNNSVGPNDLAILRLSTPLNYTNAIREVGLPNNFILLGFATLSGWGSTTSQSISNTLQTATIPLSSLFRCTISLILQGSNPTPLALSNICTRPLLSNIAPCSGDSGGPLVQYNQLVGVVSWGPNRCGSLAAPSVYVRVYSFIQWINDNRS